jgi:hypothetical protein
VYWAITVGAGVTAVAAARWWSRERERDARRRELLALSEDDDATSTAHLSRGLAELVRQARAVRHVLATPLAYWDTPLAPETPWGRRARCDAYDRAIGEARRTLWEWLLLFRRLDERDRLVLLGLGLSPAPFYAALFRPGVFDRSDDLWEEVLYPEAPDLARVFVELRRTMIALRAFEATLLSRVTDPYRR